MRAPLAPFMILLATLAFSSTMAQSPPQGRTAAGDPAAALVLARVNSDSITLADLRASFGSRHDGHGALLVGREIITKVLDKAIEEQLLIQEGRRMGIADEPAFKVSVSIYRDTLLLDALEERFVRRSSEPTPADVQKAYALLPRQLRVSIIETRTEQRAQEAGLRLKLGESFEETARRMSVHQSRTQGGDLGWVTWGTMDEASETVAFSLSPGQVSDPYKSTESWRILKLVQTQQATPPPLDKVAERISAILSSRRQGQSRAALLGSIRSEHPPAQNAAAIARLTQPPALEGDDATDPPDETVLLTTATGLTVTAAHVRHRARRSGLSTASAFQAAADDALLIDEARRRMKPDQEMLARIRRYEDGKIRDELERTVILKDISITDEEVKTFYQKNPAAYSSPASYHVRHIVLPDEAAALEVRHLLETGSDFATLARQRSLDIDSAAAGGDIGWIEGSREGGSDSPAQGIAALAPGQLSQVIHSARGYSIAQVLEIRPGAAPSYEQARHEAAQRLMIQKQRDLREAFLQKLRKSSTVTRYPQALDRAVALQDKQAGAKAAAAPRSAPSGNRP